MNTKIQLSFNKSAATYDQCSDLQREIADRLFEQVSIGPQPLALLDVGCGTGYLTGRLKERFPQSKIIGLDFSPKMIEVANSKSQDIAWILADGGALPFVRDTFDLLVSNLAYQWSGDLTRSFSQARRVLAPGGTLACTLFGFHTCQELFHALNASKAQDLKFKRLPLESGVHEALVKGGFKDPQVRSERIQKEFHDMYDLLGWLKAIGANTLAYEGYLGAGALSQASTIYRQQFMRAQGVTATFEVLWVYVKK